MVKRQFRPKTVTVLDDDKKLYEIGSKEVWQLPLISSDGEVAGVVVRQVIEPLMYTVRYLVIFSPQQNRQFIIPANTLADITTEEVICNLTSQQLAKLPTFDQTLSPQQEQAVYEVLDRTPYWVEEQEAMGPPNQCD